MRQPISCLASTQESAGATTLGVLMKGYASWHNIN
jgi:hypothetical protein